MARKGRGRSGGRRAAPKGAAAAERTAEGIFPAEFRERMSSLLGDRSAAFYRALADPPSGLRVNTLRLSPERFREISDFDLEPLPYPEAGFLVDASARPGKHPYHAAGLYYLQDPGAMAVAAMVDPQPGERVLDLAAAPGGKATHLAALMQGQGVLVANDVQPARTRELIGNLERCGVRNAIVTLESAERLADHFGAWFDRVLLDAPCSGEAMFHKSAAARAGWSAASVAGCSRRQGDLVREAARMVRPGGRLVYSTCTFSPEEDEEVVARFLRDHAGWDLIDLPEVPGAEPGRPDWAAPSLRAPSLSRAVRLWPDRVPGAGHFVAGLGRQTGERVEPRPHANGPAPRAALDLWEEFCRTYGADIEATGGVLSLRGQELYRLPDGSPDLGRLRVERPGWWLGTVQKNRFEPAHALGLALASADAQNTIDLDVNDPAVIAFLRGETLTHSGEPGWVLLRVGGFALGWGKRVGETVKNHYPKGLRRRG